MRRIFQKKNQTTNKISKILSWTDCRPPILQFPQESFIFLYFTPQILTHFCFTPITHFISPAHFNWIQPRAAPSLSAQIFSLNQVWFATEVRGRRCGGNQSSACFESSVGSEWSPDAAMRAERRTETGYNRLTGPATLVSDNITELQQHPALTTGR